MSGTELTPEELDKKKEEDFESGRLAVRQERFGEEKQPEVENPADDTPAGAPAEAEGEGKNPEKLEEEPVVFGGLTESELKSTLAKANEYDRLKESMATETQKIYGKFGEVQRELKKLSEGRPSNLNVKLAKLAESYPELAEILEEDLAGLAGGQASSFDPTEIQAQFDAKLKAEAEKITDGFQEKLLTIRQPKWKEKIQTPDYKLWFGTLPKERQDELAWSRDGLVTAQALDDFDTWTTRGKKGKQNRLERAITPDGAPPDPQKKQLSDEAAFEEGRLLARKRLGLLR